MDLANQLQLSRVEIDGMLAYAQEYIRQNARGYTITSGPTLVA